MISESIKLIVTGFLSVTVCITLLSSILQGQVIVAQTKYTLES